MQCHGANGKGSGKESRLLMDQIGLVRKEVSIAAVKYGQRGEITVNGSSIKCHAIYGSH
jgi:hypothetical protein